MTFFDKVQAKHALAFFECEIDILRYKSSPERIEYERTQIRFLCYTKMQSLEVPGDNKKCRAHADSVFHNMVK